MNEESSGSVHWSFWVIAVVALLWNAAGCIAYISELNPAAVEDEAYRAMIETRPAWATGAFAIAVWGGVLGSLVLLLRKSAAFYIFVVSLLGLAVQMYYNLFVAKSTDSYGPGELAMIIMIPAIAVFLVWYTRYAGEKGWVS